MGCGCSDLSDVLTALPIVLRLDDGRTLGVRVPGVPVVVPMVPMPECPNSGPNYIDPQYKIVWLGPYGDCDGQSGNNNNLKQQRHKCRWRYAVVNGQEYYWVACSQWTNYGCTSEPPRDPLCVTESNEKACSDTAGICQTQ